MKVVVEKKGCEHVGPGGKVCGEKSEAVVTPEFRAYCGKHLPKKDYWSVALKDD